MTDIIDMTDTMIFLSGLVLTASASIAALAYIHAPLSSILRDLCGTSERAAFWVAFSNVILVLVPFTIAFDRPARRRRSSLLSVTRSNQRCSAFRRPS